MTIHLIHLYHSFLLTLFMRERYISEFLREMISDNFLSVRKCHLPCFYERTQFFVRKKSTLLYFILCILYCIPRYIFYQQGINCLSEALL